MTNPISAKVLTDIIKKEPVVAAQLALWILANIGFLIVGHTHLVDSATWNGIATTVAPVLSGLILGLFTWVTRRYVEPIFKKL